MILGHGTANLHLHPQIRILWITHERHRWAQISHERILTRGLAICNDVNATSNGNHSCDCLLLGYIGVICKNYDSTFESIWFIFLRYFGWVVYTRLIRSSFRLRICDLHPNWRWVEENNCNGEHFIQFPVDVNTNHILGQIQIGILKTVCHLSLLNHS